MLGLVKLGQGVGVGGVEVGGGLESGGWGWRIGGLGSAELWLGGGIRKVGVGVWGWGELGSKELESVGWH